MYEHIFPYKPGTKPIVCKTITTIIRSYLVHCMGVNDVRAATMVKGTGRKAVRWIYWNELGEAVIENNKVPTSRPGKKSDAQRKGKTERESEGESSSDDSESSESDGDNRAGYTDEPAAGDGLCAINDTSTTHHHRMSASPYPHVTPLSLSIPQRDTTQMQCESPVPSLLGQSPQPSHSGGSSSSHDLFSPSGSSAMSIASSMSPMLGAGGNPHMTLIQQFDLMETKKSKKMRDT